MYRLLMMIVAGLIPSVVQIHDEEVEKTIRELIPPATAMSAEDWNRLVLSAAPEVESEPLMYLLIFKCDPLANEKHKQDFSYPNGEAPDPARLAGEIARGSHRTLIHPDRITSLTCEIRMETAKGVVEFETPGLVKGRFAYRALEADDGWKITEFTLLASRLRVQLQDDGNWLEVEIPEDE